MDDHFRTAPLEENLPVIMGLLGRVVPQCLGLCDPRHSAL